MTYEEMGAILRQEREKQNMAVDAVADKLKISPRLIGALESGDLSSLPHSAYVKGFIRSYGRLLGIGQDEMQTWFEDIPAPQQAPETVATEQPTMPPPPPARKSGGFGKGLVGLLVLLLLCGGGWWAWKSGKLEAWLPTKKQDTDFESRVPSAADYLAEKAPTQEPAQAPETVTAPVEVPVAPPAQIPVTEARIPEAQEQPARQEGIQPGQHKLIITATEECWIHSNADKTDTRQFSLRKGDTFALTFGKSLELKLGNAGGVRLRYDGKDLGPAGTSGQVRTIGFPLPDERDSASPR